MRLDEVDDGEKYNQFEGKITTYKEEIYTTKIDQNKITEDLKKKAYQVEKDIKSKDS